MIPMTISEVKDLKIHISATGSLKVYLPSEITVELAEGMCLEDIKLHVGIPSSVISGFVINHILCGSDTPVKEGDRVKFLMVVGGG